MPNIRNEYIMRLDIARIKKRRFSIYLVVDLIDMKILRRYKDRDDAINYIKFLQKQEFDKMQNVVDTLYN